MTLKKSYGIELNEDQELVLKLRFDCETDGELRNALQTAILRIVSYDRATKKELSDHNSMKFGKIRG